MADGSVSFASLPLPDLDHSIEEIRCALDELAAYGVALLTNHGGVYQGDDRLDPLYTELDAPGAVCLVHPAVPAPDAGRAGTGSPLPAIQPSVLEFPFDTTRAIANLVANGTLHKFPHIRFVFTHCGGCVSSPANRLIDRRPLRAYQELAAGSQPPSVEQIERLLVDAQRRALTALRTVYFDIALSSDERALRALAAVVPVERFLVGTDYPMAQEIGAHVTLAGLDRFGGFTSDDRSAVRRGNAAGLLPRLAGNCAGANEHVRP